MKRTPIFLLWLAFASSATGQMRQPIRLTQLEQTGTAAPHDSSESTVPLDAAREKRALQIFLKSVEKAIASAAEAMPTNMASLPRTVNLKASVASVSR